MDFQPVRVTRDDFRHHQLLYSQIFVVKRVCSLDMCKRIGTVIELLLCNSTVKVSCWID